MVVKDPSTSYEVFRTREYSQFSFADENRVIYESHINRLKQSIQENGYLEEMPIHVIRRDGALVITDGQHRFTACRELELEILYSVKEDEQVSKSIRVVNAYSRAWKDHDFMRHFVALGYPSYLALRDFMVKHDIGMAAGMGVLARADTKDVKALRHLFKTGCLDFRPQQVEKGDERMAPVNEIRNLHERMFPVRNSPAFIKALLIITGSPRYEHDRFLQNLVTNIVTIAPCTSLGRYLEMLTTIYNYRRMAGTRVTISRKGISLLQQDDGDE